METSPLTPSVGIGTRAARGGRRALVALAATALAALAGCTPGGSSTPSGPGPGEPIPWVAPSSKPRPGADDRVTAALLTADRIGGLPAIGEPKNFIIEPQLCDQQPETFKETSASAAAMWQDGDVRVVQGTVSFRTAVADAAAAVAEVRAKATCESFTARDGRHVLVRVPDLAPVAGVDAAHVVCEELRGDERGRGDAVRGARCTALLARDDVMSVLYAIALTRERAESLARVAAGLSAATLVKAW
ncbi:hypothetical protein ACFQZ4_52045 [Catellatospora coxensis]|uniref:PknH-like protein n=1 Tax=Catellatospora coxensis TaxID=310354 RepID=A0A8J3L319_9ACTN|nr:hypothetical protein [Catellatospora coxensis]GIG06790.1 hypothetical protein Cco03nite_34900 [Catellatospora coxensis]